MATKYIGEDNEIKNDHTENYLIYNGFEEKDVSGRMAIWSGSGDFGCMGCVNQICR